MASPKAGDQCQVHRLRFEALTGEFEGDDPDLRELLHGFVAGRCQAQVLDHEGNYARVALCAEDIELTDDSSLFDESGAFVFACPGHATWLQEQAVDDRAKKAREACHLCWPPPTEHRLLPLVYKDGLHLGDRARAEREVLDVRRRGAHHLGVLGRTGPLDSTSHDEK